MADITLSGASRTTLFEVQKMQSLLNRTAARLSTGTRANAVENPRALFLAIDLTDRAGDLLRIVDGISGAASTVGTALGAIDSVITLVNQMRGIAVSAKGGAVSGSAAETQFDQLRTQIDALVNDATFLGTNLLKAPPDTLRVNLDQSGAATLTVSGVASDASALGINAVTADHGFATDAGIDASVAELDAALATLRTTRKTLGANDALLNTRLRFTRNLIDTLQKGSDTLINADLDAEAANLLALRTRQDLARAALSLSFRNGSSVLRLLQLGQNAPER